MAADSTIIEPDFGGMAVTYEAVGDLPIMPTEADAWSVASYGEAMRETQRLADAFGMSAKAARSKDSDYEFVAIDEATGATVTLWNHLAIGGWWSYMTNGDVSVSSPGCDPDSQDCDRVAPDELEPMDLLNAQEAIARAETYLSAAEIEPIGFALSGTESPRSTDVNGVLEVDGVPSNVMVTFSFGDGGVLLYASGPVFSVVAADTYPLVAVDVALDRLSQPRFSYFGSAIGSAIDIASMDTQQDTTLPVTVPITDVRLTLMESNLDNDTHMLLPAFTFSNADGDVGTVIAVSDEFLVFPDLPPVQPDPGPEPPEVPVTRDSAETLIGLTEDEAVATASERGWQLRVAQRDDEYFMLSADYREDRVNIVVKNGLVTSVEIG